MKTLEPIGSFDRAITFINVKNKNYINAVNINLINNLMK